MELLKNESYVYGNSGDNVNVLVELPAMQDLGKIEIDPSTRISDPKDNNILPNKQYKKIKAQLKLVVMLLS